MYEIATSAVHNLDVSLENTNLLACKPTGHQPQKKYIMTEIETIRAFFGWSTAINFALLILSSVLLVALRGTISKIHSKMFGVSELEITSAYFQYLANFKIAIVVFSLVPYIALCIMS